MALLTFSRNSEMKLLSQGISLLHSKHWWNCLMRYINYRIHYRKPRVRRVPQGLPCAIHRAHGEESICRAYKINTRRTKSTRRRQSSLCAPGQAHGEATVRRAPQPRHTAKRAPRVPTLTAVGCSSTLSIFAVCQRLAHREPSSLPCASGQHTAMWWPR